MATLHVRNVPDELYERLRLTSEQNGRSIGGEVMVILQTMLASSPAQPRIPPPRRRRKAASPFEHFSPRARQVVVDAQEESARLGHAAIETEHLLLALLREAKVAIVLEHAGLVLDRARDSVVTSAGEGQAVSDLQRPFSARTKKALELALRESLQLRAEAVEPEHLLLGVLGVEDGLGAQIVRAYEPSVERLRMNVLQVAASPAASMRYGVDEFRVIELEGEPGDWEAQLNATAEEGYRLLQIVERRAIFRRPW